MKTFILFSALLMALPALVVAQDAETIDHVTDDNVIVLQNGDAYESQDATSSTWTDNDDVLILDDGRMVNKDQDEVVDVTATTAPDEDSDDEDSPDNE
jgi:hypothetical protein